MGVLAGVGGCVGWGGCGGGGGPSSGCVGGGQGSRCACGCGGGGSSGSEPGGTPRLPKHTPRRPPPPVPPLPTHPLGPPPACVKRLPMQLPTGSKRALPYALTVLPPLGLALSSPGLFFDALDFAGGWVGVGGWVGACQWVGGVCARVGWLPVGGRAAAPSPALQRQGDAGAQACAAGLTGRGLGGHSLQAPMECWFCLALCRLQWRGASGMQAARLRACECAGSSVVRVSPPPRRTDVPPPPPLPPPSAYAARQPAGARRAAGAGGRGCCGSGGHRRPSVRDAAAAGGRVRRGPPAAACRPVFLHPLAACYSPLPPPRTALSSLPCDLLSVLCD